jgi:hypothetical protein
MSGYFESDCINLPKLYSKTGGSEPVPSLMVMGKKERGQGELPASCGSGVSDQLEGLIKEIELPCPYTIDFIDY